MNVKQPALGITPAPLSHHGGRHSPNPRHWGSSQDRIRCMPSPSVGIVLIFCNLPVKEQESSTECRYLYLKYFVPFSSSCNFLHTTLCLTFTRDIFVCLLLVVIFKYNSWPFSPIMFLLHLLMTIKYRSWTNFHQTYCFAFFLFVTLKSRSWTITNHIVSLCSGYIFKIPFNNIITAIFICVSESTRKHLDIFSLHGGWLFTFLEDKSVHLFCACSVMFFYVEVLYVFYACPWDFNMPNKSSIHNYDYLI